MFWLGFRQLTVVGIAEYAEIAEQLYWKGIIYPSGIRLRETLGIRKLAHASNWSLKTALDASIANPLLIILVTQLPSLEGTKVTGCNETLLSKQQTLQPSPLHQTAFGRCLERGDDSTSETQRCTSRPLLTINSSCCAFHENSSSPGQTPVCVTAFIG